MEQAKVSIVTISFNQAEFIERTIRSVLAQSYSNLEYIVIDPGSTDGSREIISRYADRIAHVVFERDDGPSDGLNKGFHLATGDIFGFLNSDDVLAPSATKEAVAFLRDREDIDVVSGNCFIIDAYDRVLRLGYSDCFDLRAYAYGACVLLQPSTFFRASAFRRTNGFNVLNRSGWDGELFVDMALEGARFARTSQFWSGYRLHDQSITSSARLDDLMKQNSERIFEKIMNRRRLAADKTVSMVYRLIKHIRTPRALYERITKGPIYGRSAL